MNIKIRGCARRRQILRRNSGARRMAAGAIMLAVAVTAPPALAETLLPSVEVDLSALDQLGPAGPVRAKDRITLRRPKGAPVTIAKKPAVQEPPAAQPAPAAVKATEPAPEIVKEPAAAPEVAKEPEPAPAVVKAPEPATKSAKEPEAEPEMVKEPDPEPEIAKEPEPEVVKEPEPEVVKEPEQTPAPAKEPEPEIAKEPDATPAPTETASVPAAPPPAGMIRLAFVKGSAELPDDAGEKLATLAAQMKNDQTIRVQLRGFSAGDGSAGRQARRLALSRALAVRLYLTQNGVGGTRALVRALGSETEEQPMDRVDVVVIE